MQPLIETQTKPKSRLLDAPPIPGWAILPMRGFLGFSFIAAGLDKLTDPAFLDPAARNYIGNQIAGMARGTPIEGFLLGVAQPNAPLFGVMVMGGELCIGVAVLLGLLTRFSAFMGLMLSLTFYLSATWDIRPFYFGADLPYAFGWLTLLLAGSGPLALDALVGRWLAATAQRDQAPATIPVATGRPLTRRALLGAGAAGLAGAVLAATGLGWGVLHGRRAQAQVLGVEGPAATTALEPAAGAVATPVAAGAGTAGKVIAAPGALPHGQMLQFVLPSGDPGVLVHGDYGYKAFSTICTHMSCEVAPAGGSLLRCPCHGAEYDLNDNASVVTGPATRPLDPIPVVIEPDGSVHLTS
jgi:thiosulfate dehydrogenase (quinone) large subunit